MRIYVPATRRDLDEDSLTPEQIHAVTPQLRAELPDDDEEMLELVAFLAAADDSVRLIAERDELPRRLVISADVEAGTLVPPPAGELETVLVPTGPVRWDQVAAFHADDAAAASDVEAAGRDDDAAFERLGERDLMWFDPSELAELRDELDS